MDEVRGVQGSADANDLVAAQAPPRGLRHHREDVDRERELRERRRPRRLRVLHSLLSSRGISDPCSLTSQSDPLAGVAGGGSGHGAQPPAKQNFPPSSISRPAPPRVSRSQPPPQKHQSTRKGTHITRRFATGLIPAAGHRAMRRPPWRRRTAAAGAAGAALRRSWGTARPSAHPCSPGIPSSATTPAASSGDWGSAAT